MHIHAYLRVNTYCNGKCILQHCIAMSKHCLVRCRCVGTNR